MNTYGGVWDRQEWYQVKLNGVRFNPAPSQAIWNHSPDGFAWGYQGSGPAQLALAILYNETNDREKALANYQDFKRQVIANFPQEGGFTLTSEQVQEWLSRR